MAQAARYQPSHVNDLIAAVFVHANEHYNEGGWDIVVECWDDDDVSQSIGNARTPEQAIHNVARTVRSMDSYRRDIQGA